MESSCGEGAGIKLESAEALKLAHDEVAALQSALSEKEFTIRNLICTHEKLKATSKEEIAKLEAEKTGLISSLDEANLIREEREETLGVCREEIKRLRSLLAESQKNCKETEEWARSGKEAKMREELLIQFEEERNKVEDKLKWKREQFDHLEEAHKRLQSELRELKRENEVEKLEFLRKIGELESGFDEKTRLAEDLRTRLEICNQVLAREESKRKLLEVELRESRDQYDSLVTDFEVAKAAVDSVTAQRDGEIASLRGILADKSIQIKELEFEKAQIEQANQELGASLKEYREIEIGGVEKSKKYRALEKAHRGCGEKIRVREAEIENMKRDMNDHLAQLNEKKEIIEKLQSELKGKEKITIQEVETEKLKRDLNSCLSCLNERDEFIEKLQNELQVTDLIQIEMMLEVEMGVAFLVLKENLKKHFEKSSKSDALILVHSDKEDERLVSAFREREVIDEVNNLKERLEDLMAENERLLSEVKEKNDLMGQAKKCVDREKVLVEENESLVGEVKEREEALLGEREKFLCAVREKNDAVVQIKECMDREKALLGENKTLICKLKEREGVVEQLNLERAKLLEKENERLLCEDEERKQVKKELAELKNSLETVVKEREMLHGEAIALGRIAQQFGECKEREEALMKENERLISEIREKEELIEELRGEIALLREHNSRLQSEVCTLEEEKKNFVEMGKKLLEIKFKLDPLEEKCTEVVKARMNEVSGMEMNFELLVEELENSVSEKEMLELELQEMTTTYFLQKHEIEFRGYLFSDLEMEVEKLKFNLRVKKESFEAQLERERFENEANRVRLSNDIKRLQREKEILALQLRDLNCGIGSLLCADGEIKAISDRILQKIGNEGENMHEKKFRPLVQVAGTRSPLKENNY
ncbi:hypothetical protein LUZ61_016429 [Rhynchospora tenuis]|uniref:Uncharacterized protein n=1 Tax=Rhynchospora tenuis TaxID=198213 RepID=A0AAD5Z5G7_9POAL|nr:hypothetical protein LUZ61_016429 [Rhynchospora tenuis]